MPAPLVGVILAALLVSGVAGAALAVSHPAAATPCSSSTVKDSSVGAHSLDSQQNVTENDTGDLNDSGDLNDTGDSGSGSGCSSPDSSSASSPDGSGVSPSVRFA